MRWSIMPIWDCAKGPIQQLTPATRIVVASLVFAVCAVSQPTRLLGLLYLVITIVAWLLLTQPPARLLRSLMFLGLVMLSPVFLLAPFMERHVSFSQALSTPFTVFARGLAGMLVSVVAVTTLNPGELHQGLRSLRVPAVAATLAMQIVQQTGTLAEETRRIGSALALRGASQSTGSSWRMLRAFPLVWLPRVILRAERLALAMELRGFGVDVPIQQTTRMQVRDAATIVLAAAWLLLMLGIRAWRALL